MLRERHVRLRHAGIRPKPRERHHGGHHNCLCAHVDTARAPHAVGTECDVNPTCGRPKREDGERRRHHHRARHAWWFNVRPRNEGSRLRGGGRDLHGGAGPVGLFAAGGGGAFGAHRVRALIRLVPLRLGLKVSARMIIKKHNRKKDHR